MRTPPTLKTAQALPCVMSMLASFGGCAGATPERTTMVPRLDIDTQALDMMVESNGFRFGRPGNIIVSPDGSRVYFLRGGPREARRDLFVVDVAAGTERELASATRLLGGAQESVSAEEQARRERLRLVTRGIGSFSMFKDGSKLLVTVGQRAFVVDAMSGESRELLAPNEEPLDDLRVAPSGLHVAGVRAGELVVRDLANGRERVLTRGATSTRTHGLAEFVAQEEMDRYEGFWWSPDSARIVVQTTDESAVEILRIADPLRPDVAPRELRYPRAGRANASIELSIIPALGGSPVPVVWDRAAFPYLAKLVWIDPAAFAILVQNREQTEERLLRVDASTGQSVELLRESDSAWLNIDQSVPRFLPTGQFLWSTERTGAYTLELRAADGSFERTLVPAEEGYRSLVRLGTGDNPDVWIEAAAASSERHIVRFLLAGGPLQHLTSGPAENSAIVSRDGNVWVRLFDRLDGQHGDVVLRPDGTELARLDGRVEPARSPRVSLETITVENTTYHYGIVRPPNMNRSAKYPTIEVVYGGPHSNMVRANWQRWMLSQWFAEHGFIVISMDTHGTPFRGREWERTIKNDVITQPLAEHVAVLDAIAARTPEIDRARIGIYGWSFGGYFSAMAAMRAPEMYRAAVAGAPVVDWRDYDTHYTERYMSTPETNGAGYDRANVLTYAGELSRPLLLIHGTADDNVYFFHSLRLMDALVRQGRDITFLPLPGQTHIVSDPAMWRQSLTRTLRFFVEHLQ